MLFERRNKMTVRERIELALRIIHGDLRRKCFCCKHRGDPSGGGEKLGFALMMMGVPCGIHEMFELREIGDTACVRTERRCGMSEGHDPDWQKFIDEVVSLVGE